MNDVIGKFKIWNDKKEVPRTKYQIPRTKFQAPSTPPSLRQAHRRWAGKASTKFQDKCKIPEKKRDPGICNLGLLLMR